MSLNGEDRAAQDDMLIRVEGEDPSQSVLSINIKYVLEAVSSITSDSVRMEWIDDVHGIIFCPALGAGGVVGAAGELHLVMPMVV